MKPSSLLLLFILLPSILWLTPKRLDITLSKSKNSINKKLSWQGYFPKQFNTRILFIDEHKNYANDSDENYPLMEVSVNGRCVITTTNNLNYIHAQYTAYPACSNLNINGSIVIEYTCAIWGDKSEDELRKEVINEVSKKIIHQLEII